MKQPCNDCPFRVENGIRLSPERIEEIVSTIMHDGSFHCHKTVEYCDGEPRTTSKSQLCFGSVLFLENAVRGGCRSNVLYRFGLMLHQFEDSDLRKTSDVFQSLEDMLDLAF